MKRVNIIDVSCMNVGGGDNFGKGSFTFFNRLLRDQHSTYVIVTSFFI